MSGHEDLAAHIRLTMYREITKAMPGSDGAAATFLANDEDTIALSEELADAARAATLRRQADIAAKALTGLVNIHSPERRRLAYHEAGHAVAMLATGMPFDFVSIRPDARWGAKGIVAGPDPYRHTDRRETVKEIVAFLAGGAAEELHTGADGGGSMDDDLGHAMRLAGRIVSGKSLKTYTMGSYRDALDLVRGRRAELDAVATALLSNETMGYDEVKILFDATAVLAKVGRLG